MAWPPCGDCLTKKARRAGNCPRFPARTSPMRFDPKLIHPEEPPLDAAGELDLPADLAALGEQLRDDAAHLAAKFPSAEGRHVRPSGRSRASSRYVVALLGSALAAALI